MKLRTTTGFILMAGLLAAAPIAAQDRKKIEKASDIPPVVLELPKKPSELVTEGGPEFNALLARVKSHAETLLNDYEINDASTAKQLRSVMVQVAHQEGRWEDMIRLIEEIRTLEDKPAAKATAGLINIPYARAAMAVGKNSPQFAQRFEAELTQVVNALDWELTQDTLRGVRAQFQLMSADLMVGGLQGGMDVQAAAQNNKVGFGTGVGVIGSRIAYTDIVPLKDVVFKVLDRRVSAENVEKEDLWTKRLVTLNPAEVKQPVTIAIWDSGFDPAVFEGRLWKNPNPGKADDLHGIAFDPDWRRSSGALRPMPPEDLDGIADKLKLVKGSLDLQAAVDSPEASAYREKISSLKPEEVIPFSLQSARLGFYLHGTATGYTSAEGNPGARMMFARFDARADSVLPTALDEEVADQMVQYIRDTVGFFKTNGARVVNMSWRMTEPQIASTLSVVEPDPERRKQRAKAVFDKVSAALEQEFRNAPNILFVAGAGNEDQDVDFVRSFPAGINLPNVITVGAVNVSLKPAGFTSYGSSIDVYANGFEVPSKVPGGMPIRISGTSLSAPYVTNLAGKMLAVNPKLTVAQIRSIIEETATAEGERRLKVINPVAAMERARRF